jgi:dihydrodipicolinate synthase/N-acetylneuraminate lyase
VKAALALMGRVGPTLRLPLTELSAANRKALKATLAEHGLITRDSVREVGERSA